MSEPRKVAWGYVRRHVPIYGDQILVAQRFKKGDEKREGQLVLPGGGLEDGETHEQRAITEVYEETGINAYLAEENELFSREIKRLRKAWSLPNLKATLQNGVFQLEYTDSRKSYEGQLFRLAPNDISQNPVENLQSDARKPEYALATYLKSNSEKFTPACQVLLSTIGEVEGW